MARRRCSHNPPRSVVAPDPLVAATRQAMAAAPLTILDAAPAAGHIGVATSTIKTAAWRRRHGIPVVRIGKTIRFELGALDRWLLSRSELDDVAEVVRARRDGVAR
jgi:hypothetical protein